MTREFNISDYPNSNRALHFAHRTWIPNYSNPSNLILTFANDVSEEQARKIYSLFIHKLSKPILKNGYTRFGKLIDQRGYLEFGDNGGFHIHTLVDVREDWNGRFIQLVNRLWIYGIVVKNAKVPVNELALKQAYDSKMKTKRTESGHYSDSYLVV